MKVNRIAFAWFGLILLIVQDVQSAIVQRFDVPSALKPHIEFWKRVYGEWSVDQIVFFDEDNPSLIYLVIDVPDAGSYLGQVRRENAIKNAKEEVRKALKFLHRLKPDTGQWLKGRTLDVFLNLQNLKISHKYEAPRNVRAQNGLRERFELGYKLSGRFDEEIKKRLRASGLPQELIAIAFVESLFYVPARSKSGAVGLWQIMKPTGKQYLHINRLVDERLDPIISTDAAIRYLKHSKKLLKTWPLAITSYNVGRTGTLRARNAVGSSNLGDIIKKYRKRRFGFAAKNYYAEFLAALYVYQNAKNIFPKVKRHPHWHYEVVQIPHAAFLHDIARVGAASKKWLMEYNPALSKHVKSGLEVLPKGFTLRVPVGGKKRFTSRMSKLSRRAKRNAQRRVRARHRSNGRQSVKQIAKRYDIRYKDLARRLGYSSSRKPTKNTVILLRSMDSLFSRLPDPLHKPAKKHKS